MVARRRAARRQHRRLNDRALRSGADRGASLAFRCECSEPRCDAVVRLSAAGYEAVRSEPGRYVLAPGHQRDDLDMVVGRRGAYVVVDEPAAELFLG